MQLEISDDEMEPSGRHPSIAVGSFANEAAAAAGNAGNGGQAGGGGASHQGQSGQVSKAATSNMADELDNLMDISIEIASNKRMKRDHLKPFRLTFKDKDLEKRVWT